MTCVETGLPLIKFWCKRRSMAWGAWPLLPVIAKKSQKDVLTKPSSCSEHPTLWGQGRGTRATGWGLASQGAMHSACLRHGLHHHRARGSQVGLPRGWHDLEYTTCNHTSTRSISNRCVHSNTLAISKWYSNKWVSILHTHITFT